MSSRNETKILLLSLVLTLVALIGGGGWLWKFITQKQDVKSNTDNETETVVVTDNKINENISSENLSSGQQWLITQSLTPTKQEAIMAFNKGNYGEAVVKLEQAIEENPNDPEALIYLNNARIGQGQSYGIAVAVPIGVEVNVANEILRGVAQSQNEVNHNGGIKGIPLRVTIVNDNNQAELAIKVAEALGSQNEILGVIGHFSSDVTLAAIPIYEKNNLVVLSPSSTSVEISGASDYLFRTVPSDFFTGNALAKYMLEELKLTKAAIFYVSTSSYSNSLRNVVTTALYNGGGEVVFESDLTLTDFNPSDAIKQAQDRGAEVLMFVSNSASLDKAIQVIQVNEHRLKMLAGDSLYNPRILELGRKDAVGMILAIPWHIYSNRDSKFAQDATQLWKGDVNWRTAMSYDATEVLITAIKLNPTRTGLQQALANPSFVSRGAGKDIRFLPSGDRNQAVQLVTVESAPDFDFHYRFMPLK